MIVYAKRSGWPTGELPPPNADGGILYEAIGDWFDHTCRYVADRDLGDESANRLTIQFAEIGRMPEAAE